MTVARRWVFSILWMLIFAAIAAALTKVAFFPDAAPDASAPDQPGAVIVEPQWQVTLGTVRNDVTLTGTVASDAAVPVLATLSGEVREVTAAVGNRVEAGQQLALLRAELSNPDGTTYTKWDYIVAPATGTLSSFSVLYGQQFSVGQTVGQVAPPTFNVSGSIPPEQLYRLIQRPSEAQVSINGGPAPFTCTGLTISTPLAGAGDGGTPNPGGSGPVVTCAVPADVTVFAGLTAELVIPGGIAENVLVIPTTAVEGGGGTGTVYLSLPDGSTEPREVTLGLNDGVQVQVIAGLEEGDLILQFVPGAPADVPIDGMPQPGIGISK